MDRTCVKCGKVFGKPCLLKRHNQRKTSCAPIVSHTDLAVAEQARHHACKFCGHRFASAPGLSRHMKNSCKIAGSAEGMEKLYEHTLKKHHQETAVLRAQVAALQSQVQALALPQASASAVTQHAQVIVNAPQVTTNNIININLFGGEKTDHIGLPQVRGLLDQTLKINQDPVQAAAQALIRAATLIYSDPTHPENLTCYLPNKKTDDVMVHGDGGWQIQPCQVVLPPMAARSCDLLFDNQPFEDAALYGDLMIALRDNEEAFNKGHQMRTILVRNKDLLDKALGSLPR